MVVGGEGGGKKTHAGHEKVDVSGFSRTEYWERGKTYKECLRGGRANREKKTWCEVLKGNQHAMKSYETNQEDKGWYRTRKRGEESVSVSSGEKHPNKVRKEHLYRLLGREGPNDSGKGKNRALHQKRKKGLCKRAGDVTVVPEEQRGAAGEKRYIS